MREQLEKFREAALKELEQLRSAAELELARVRHLGRGSELSQFLRTLKDRATQERKELGEVANHIRQELEERFKQTKDRLADAVSDVQHRLDVTAPGFHRDRGHIHILTQAQEEINTIFASMGFRILEGPEVETDFNNFEALNIPPDHPARDLQDTFWLTGMQHLMRTHTSTMQLRFMQAHQPPFRIIVPGTIYRNEATDSTHEFQFHQIEGLMVDRKESPNVPSLAHLKGILEYWLRRFFNDRDLQIKFNASYFPFVEPGVEIFMQATHGKLAGRWIELGGAGMVHQNVFEKVGYVKGEMQGFAFGMGLERLAMLKYKIDDIRLFNSGDLRFLKQF